MNPAQMSKSMPKETKQLWVKQPYHGYKGTMGLNAIQNISNFTDGNSKKNRKITELYYEK